MLERKTTAGLIAGTLIGCILLIDQWIKVLVKTSFYLYEKVRITDWFYLCFTENEGMAFGWSFVGTLLLASFRVVLSVWVIYYLVQIIQRRYPLGFLVCVSMVLAGALGNILDNAFYGLVFTESTPYAVSRLVEWGEGYSTFMSGKVVDMFYFPLVEFVWPEWMPWLGGRPFIFFSPIFNFADASISCGGIATLLFYRDSLAALIGKPQIDK